MPYLDNNATTRPTPAVVDAVRRGVVDFWQNPSSVHRAGQAVRYQVELAREQLANLVKARPRDVVLTSSGTEAIDLCIRGVLEGGRPGSLLTTRVEHAAVREIAEEYAASGRAAWAPLRAGGIVDLPALAAMLADSRGPHPRAGSTIGLVSVQWANNETGAIQPVEAIGRLCREHGVPFHCDATQWVGKCPMPGGEPFCDFLTFSPHKFHGVKGVGALVARPGVRFRPRVLGTQELGRRGGTENVPGILGAGVAAEEAISWLADTDARHRLGALRDRLESQVLAGVPDAVVNAPPDRTERLWNTSNLGFPRLEAEALLMLLSERGVSASAGAACSSGSLEPSPVLLAMGIPPEVAHGSIRLSLSRETTPAEIDLAAARIVEAVAALRRSSAAAIGRGG